MSGYSDTEQYIYVLEAGRILRKIHSIPAPATQEDWEIRFNRIVWCAQKAPLFASGIVNGYFDDNVPMGFWRLLALYISSNTLSSVYSSIVKTFSRSIKSSICSICRHYLQAAPPLFFLAQIILALQSNGVKSDMLISSLSCSLFALTELK